MKINQICTLEEILNILVDPLSKEKVIYSNGKIKNNENTFEILNNSPLLFPFEITKYFNNDWIDIKDKKNLTPLEQYFKISSVKMYMDMTNLDVEDSWYQQHLFWSKQLVSSSNGLLLDVGCDNLDTNLNVFPDDNIKYVGLEPLINKKNYFSIYGVAEFLPFQSDSFDCVSFLTSLDHVFDYFTALKEAKRVLKKGGRLYLATLVWNDGEELYKDHVHFHHFKEFEIFGALNELGFSIERLSRYKWKNDCHRTAVYLSASKE